MRPAVRYERVTIMRGFLAPSVRSQSSDLQQAFQGLVAVKNRLEGGDFAANLGI